MRMVRALVLAATVGLISLPVFAQGAPDTENAQPSVAASKKISRKANWETEKAVRKALISAKGLNSDGISVVARNGTVTLNGTVPDNSQIQIAQLAVQSVGQAKSVKNNLTVREEGN